MFFSPTGLSVFLSVAVCPFFRLFPSPTFLFCIPCWLWLLPAAAQLHFLLLEQALQRPKYGQRLRWGLRSPQMSNARILPRTKETKGCQRLWSTEIQTPRVRKERDTATQPEHCLEKVAKACGWQLPLGVIQSIFHSKSICISASAGIAWLSTHRLP